MPHHKRSRLLIDREVQLRLLCRVTLYWLVSLTLIAAMVFVMICIGSASATYDVRITRFLMSFGPVFICSLLLLPVILLDCLRFSHRFTGPIFKLRKRLKELAETGQARRISFRESDYWKELASYFNHVAERLEAKTDSNAKDTDSREQLLDSV